MRRYGRLVLLLATAAALWALFARMGPDLPQLRSQMADFLAWRDAHPVLVAALFFATYVLIAALSLPLALWMTLAAGAIFGFAVGFLLVSFASTIGATLAFLAARWAFRDWALARFGARLAGVPAAVARDGWLYLLSLRLVPAVPFFLVNLLMGLTPLRTWQFYLVSQIGMIPATAIYVNAGTQLAELRTTADILSPRLLVSLTLLGLVPLLLRAGFGLFEARHRQRRWPRPRRFDRNLVVIGGGAAGLVSAYVAAAAQARVTLVEAGAMGGDCLNYGCVPSKALISAARTAQSMREAGRFGITPAEPEIVLANIFGRVSAAIAEVAPHDSVERYRSLGVEVLQGRARLVDPWTVEVEGPAGVRQQLSSRAIVIATGSSPAIPAVSGLKEAGFLTTETLWAAFAARQDPVRRLAILGGGAAGCELSQALTRLGVEVTLIEVGARLLPREDEEVSALVRGKLAAEGVHVLTGATVLSAEGAAGGKWLTIARGPEQTRLDFDEILVVTGRASRLDGLGLEALGIPTGRFVETNDYLQSVHPNILVAGDVAGPALLTSTASHQAWHAAVNGLIAPFWRFRPDCRALPSVIYTDPEIARVGLTEAEAKAQGVRYEVTRYELADLDRAIVAGVRTGFVKILTAPGTDRILGAVIVGAQAGEMLAELTLAMRNGLGLRKILATVHSYPSFSEANRHVAGKWQQAHVNRTLLRLAARFHRWRLG